MQLTLTHVETLFVLTSANNRIREIEQYRKDYPNLPDQEDVMVIHRAIARECDRALIEHTRKVLSGRAENT